jgi:hypothetical protein
MVQGIFACAPNGHSVYACRYVSLSMLSCSSVTDYYI